jgi:hypothetical protein
VESNDVSATMETKASDRDGASGGERISVVPAESNEYVPSSLHAESDGGAAPGAESAAVPRRAFAHPPRTSR